MQTQGNIGVFGRIGTRLFQVNLIKCQRLGALSRHIFKFYGFYAQVFEGQAVHIMSGRRGVQHIGLEHCVELDSSQGDAVVSQYIGIVFEVLPQFGHFFIFQQGL